MLYFRYSYPHGNPLYIDMRNNRSRRARRSPAPPRSALAASAPNPFFTANRGPELKFLSYGTNDQQLYHNVPAFMFNATSILDAIGVGTAYYQRAGASVLLRRLEIRALLNNKSDRPNVSYRVVVAALPTSDNTDTFGEIFGVNANAANITAAQVPGVAKVYLDRYIGGGDCSVTPITSGGTAKERTFHLVHCMDLVAPIRYTAANISTTRLCVFVVAYDAYGTLTTDNIASIPNASIGIYFTDA